MIKSNLRAIIYQWVSINLIFGTVFCLPAMGATPKWEPARPFICELLMRPFKGQSANKALLFEAGFSKYKYVEERPLVSNIEAAFGLHFNHGFEAGKSSHAYRLSSLFGIPNLGGPDHYPLSVGFFVPQATIKFVELLLTRETIPADFLPARKVINTFFEMLDRDGNRGFILARLNELKQRDTIEIEGTDHIWVGPLVYGNELPVRLANEADFTKAPAVRINGLTSQDVLDGKRGSRDDGQFGNILSQPLRYGGNQTIVYPRELPHVEGSEAYIILGDRAVRGIYRGFWQPGSFRGWRL
ncbi:MAG: hypothetical protein KDD43_05250, partial [Bdellovibrionales bacterium]|nr:hypothetical protein [Bdellovibrionales bacterium]